MLRIREYCWLTHRRSIAASLREEEKIVGGLR